MINKPRTLEVLKLSLKLSMMLMYLLKIDLRQCSQLFYQNLALLMQKQKMDLWSVLLSSIVVLRRYALIRLLEMSLLITRKEEGIMINF